MKEQIINKTLMVGPQPTVLAEQAKILTPEAARLSLINKLLDRGVVGILKWGLFVSPAVPANGGDRYLWRGTSDGELRLSALIPNRKGL